FSSPGGIAGANKMTVSGDVYATGDMTLANNAVVNGSVTSLGSVTTANNSTIGGDIRAANNVTLDNPSTTVLGNVYAGGNWTMTGDTTIYADGPISLSRDMTNGAGHPIKLTIVSDFTDTPSTPAISMSNNVTLPDDVEVVYYAKNGSVKFNNLKHFTGAVYASSITLDQQFTLTFQPVTLPGFNFDLASSTHFTIQAGAFKEVPFS